MQPFAICFYGQLVWYHLQIHTDVMDAIHPGYALYAIQWSGSATPQKMYVGE